jgi:hypothetical protein
MRSYREAGVNGRDVTRDVMAKAVACVLIRSRNVPT